jgi:hypothetical protein
MRRCAPCRRAGSPGTVGLAVLRREKARVTVAAVARRANVSRTFVYDNPQARAVVAAALAGSEQGHTQLRLAQDDAQQAVWRERALNAEDALKVPTRRSPVSALGSVGSSARSAICKPSGTTRPLRGSPPRTPRSRRGGGVTGAAADRRESHVGGKAYRRSVYPALPGPAHRRPGNPYR